VEKNTQSNIFFIKLRKRLKVIAVVMIKTGESSGENSKNIHHGIIKEWILILIENF